MKTVLVLCLLLAYGPPALSCNSDFDCTYGEKCVKPSGSISLDGVCVKPVNQFGVPAQNISPPSYKPTEVKSCQFSTDCGIGFSCEKKNGEINGLCVR